MIEKIKKYWDERPWWFAYAAVAVLVVAAVLISFFAVQNWHYRGLHPEVEKKKNDTSSYTYENVDGSVAEYGIDGASLLSRDSSTIWSVKYTMSDPQMVSRGDVMAFYDADGTDVVVCDENGQTGSFTTDMPIVKADVSLQGTVALILEDGNNTWIRYYGKTGTEISAVKTSMDDPGYPMDIALSDDGMMLMVSYLSYSDNTMKSLIDYYNFDSAGQDRMDNLVAENEYENVLIPEVDYMDADTSIAFTEDGFILYEGGEDPKQRTRVREENQIVSVMHNDRNIALILENDDAGDPFVLKVYDSSGNEKSSVTLDFTYETAEFSGNQISLYNRESLRVYDLNGREKFDGSWDGTPTSFFAIGTRRYVIVTESGISWVNLR